jgi:hypothetical protein
MNSRAQSLLIIACLAGASLAAQAQSTNVPAAGDYAAFSRYIADHNVFNPNRYPRSTRTARRSESRRTVPSFALVGTMNYQKGLFAFFDGSSSDYRKVLEPGDVIAGYKVAGIAPDGVSLQTEGRAPVEMKIGTQMRMEGETWELSRPTGGTYSWNLETESSTEGTESTATAPATGGSGGEMNEVLKRLMQQREQELK